MDWKSHLFFGAALGAAIAHFALHSEAQALILFAAISGASALLPDLDTEKSKASQIVGTVAAALLLIAAAWLALADGRGIAEFALYALALLAAAFALAKILRPRHRGMTHGLLFFFAVCAVAYALLGGFFALAFAAGYFSHLLADRCIKLI